MSERYNSLANYLAESADQKEPTKPNRWEPVLSEPTSTQNFVMIYGGPYSQKMEIDRVTAERFVDVAAINGRVYITDLAVNRGRVTAGINSDGSVSAGRASFGSLKLPVFREEEEGFHRVTEVPDGWKLEIAGVKILEDLAEKRSKKPIDERFIQRFNAELRDGLRELIFRDKFRLGERSGKWKAFLTAGAPVWMGWDEFIDGAQVRDIEIIPWTLGLYGIWNFVDRMSGNPLRSFKSPYEAIMPPLEFDRFARAILFTKQKGRNLVRIQN